MDWLELLRTVVLTVVIPFTSVKLVSWATKEGKLAEARRYTHIAGEIVGTILLNNPTSTPLQMVEEALKQLERMFPGEKDEVLRRAASEAVRAKAV